LIRPQLGHRVLAEGTAARRRRRSPFAAKRFEILFDFDNDYIFGAHVARRR
jgi:hypothetical protein